MSVIREIFLIPVKLYKKILSPRKGGKHCRYYPSCSEYFLESVRKHGIIKGTTMGLMRLMRCNPHYLGGYDPVPDEYVWKRIKGEYIARKKPKGFDKEMKKIIEEKEREELLVKKSSDESI